MTIRLLVLPLCALLVAARQEAVSAHLVAGAWAIGYAAEVERYCPNWRRVPAPELAHRGLLDASRSLAGWGYDGSLHDKFWEGMEAAQRDRGAYATFCADPARVRPTSLVAQVIEPVR